ncbi:hypothetical protein [Streptomyces sp. MZ04]|uniref:mechanosensitive ion channel family protein n=1 Tax=Streptomyces sp. MZ04 TaxID=2559236 RepID=UPI00107EA284|nr:hypothetical protein [Streptomyces sp. MZ04]TGB10539.1 hypothetical protein E2651_14395 [Streptomyces sp. MZ04]
MSHCVSLSVDFTQGLNDAWSKVAQFVPQLIGFLVVLAIGGFISKMIARVLDRVLRKVGSEKLADRAGASKLLEGSKYDMTAIICKVVSYTLLLITPQLGTIVWACVVALGAIAALGRAGIATSVTQPVLYAALAAGAGIMIVGVGGGLIGPMRQRWERWLDTAEKETAKARGSVSAYQAGREDALAK